MTINEIKHLLDDNRCDDAIAAASELLDTQLSDEDRANALMLRGNAHRKLGDMRMAMNNYLEAQAIDPDGPASMALNACQQILDFYHKDYYNP